MINHLQLSPESLKEASINIFVITMSNDDTVCNVTVVTHGEEPIEN